jgi:proteasome lid subunit RPN8/RPN11
VRVRSEVLAAVEAHARRDAARECCGLLMGTTSTITEAVPCANAADDPVGRYVIAAEDYFAQIRRCRESTPGPQGRADDGPLRVVGAYHSHPRSAPEPSPTDLAEAFGQFVYLIAGPVDGSAPYSVRACTLVEGNLRPLVLVPVAEGADP